jgi:ATP-dependent DNA ligase
MHPQLLTVVDKEVLKTWTSDEWTKWRIEPKLDGYRLTYHKGQFLSRTGKPFHNLEHIGAELVQFPGMTFDGELYGKNWEDAAQARRSKNGGANTLKFFVFDALLDEDWERQLCLDTYALRSLRVRGMFNGRPIPLQYVYTPRQHKVADYDSFDKIHTQNLTFGCDGTVLKREDSLYEFKRTKTWLKVKPVQTFECKVVGLKEGAGKYKGMLGALEIRPILVDESDEGSRYYGVATFCSGMTDEQRTIWWENRSRLSTHHPDHIINKTVEVEARGVHKSGKLIEPRFIRVRHDK